MSDFKLLPKHFAVSVADIDQSIAWYRDILGFELVSEQYTPPCRSMIATMTNGFIEIEIFRHDESAPMSPERSDPDLDPRTRGMKHFCFGVDDLDALMEHFKANNVPIVNGPITFDGHKLCYITDNTGNLLEFMQ